MSDRDLPNMDDVELPDIPDDDEVAEAEAAEAAGGDDGETADGAGGGRLGPVLAVVRPLFGKVGPLVGKIGALAAPLAASAAPIGRAAAPVVAIAGPLVARVPRPLLAGVGSFAGVLLFIVLLASVVGGGRGSAEASIAAEKAAPIKSSAPLADAPKPTPKPVYTTTPAGPTATPTPSVFAPREKGWLGVGLGAPQPRHVFPAERLLLFEPKRPEYTIAAKVAVLLPAGEMAPWWGILLSYVNEAEHLRLEFYADRFQKNQPFVALATVQNGQNRPHGSGVRLAEIPFWGRDVHDVRVTVDSEIILTINGTQVHAWPHPRTVSEGQVGLYLWGESRMRVDDFTVE